MYIEHASKSKVCTNNTFTVTHKIPEGQLTYAYEPFIHKTFKNQGNIRLWNAFRTALFQGAEYDELWVLNKNMLNRNNTLWGTKKKVKVKDLFISINLI